MTPDPSQLSYADQSNPQSLNLYAYVANSPLTSIDPNGLWLQVACEDNPDYWNASTFTVTAGAQNCTVSDDGEGPSVPVGLTSQAILPLGLLNAVIMSTQGLQPTAPSNAATPQSPDRDQRVAQCIAEVRSNAKKTRGIIEKAGGLTLEETTAACLFAGPGAPECVAFVDPVVLINTGVILAGEWYNTSQEEAACAQQQ